MTHQKQRYTHIQITGHSRSIPITNTTVTGSRFIKDTRTLASYCREWLASTKGESFTCLYIPTAQTYLLFDSTMNIHFVQFAYQKTPLSPTQIAFRLFLKKRGYSVHIFNTFQTFAAFIKTYDKPVEQSAVPVEQRAHLTAWGIQLPVGTLM